MWIASQQSFLLFLQGRYEAHHDIHMQPYPEGAAGQPYNSEGYSSSSLPAQQTASTDRMRPAYPITGQPPLPGDDHGMHWLAMRCI